MTEELERTCTRFKPGNFEQGTQHACVDVESLVVLELEFLPDEKGPPDGPTEVFVIVLWLALAIRSKFGGAQTGIRTKNVNIADEPRFEIWSFFQNESLPL